MSKPKRLPESIWQRAIEDPLRPITSAGGKRIRASLIRISYQIAGGTGDVPIKLVQAIETLHAGSLIIDDIEDGSTQRRGQPCLHLEMGMPIAINTGTRMYFQALSMLTRFAADHPRGGAILGRTIRVIDRCHEGQAIDLTARADEIERKQLWPTAVTISRMKTGALTSLATWIGATVAGGDRTLTKALSRFGRNVGVCLQMHNDLDELDQFVRGGDRGDDLKNVRVTWPWAWAARRMSTTDFVMLQSRYSRAVRNHHGLREVASDLLDRVDDFGRREVARYLDQQSRLLAEHVESLELVDQMTTALAPLKRLAPTKAVKVPRTDDLGATDVNVH